MALHRYYSTMRPVSPGSYPKGVAVYIENYSQPNFFHEINRTAWGFIDCDRPLTEAEAARYELVSGDCIRIRMTTNVRPSLPFRTKPRTILRAGKEYAATTNKHGAVCGICENGESLGVKPGEFEFVTAPAWLIEIHAAAQGADEA